MNKKIGILLAVVFTGLAFWLGLLGYQKAHTPKNVKDAIAQAKPIEEDARKKEETTGITDNKKSSKQALSSTGRPGYTYSHSSNESSSNGITNESKITNEDAVLIAKETFLEKGGNMDNAKIEAEDAETVYVVFIRDDTGRELYSASIDKITGEIILSRFWN